jgi:hypothetical protein
MNSQAALMRPMRPNGIWTTSVTTQMASARTFLRRGEERLEVVLAVLGNVVVHHTDRHQGINHLREASHEVPVLVQGVALPNEPGEQDRQGDGNPARPTALPATKSSSSSVALSFNEYTNRPRSYRRSTSRSA